MKLIAHFRRLIGQLGQCFAQRRAAGLTEYALLVGLIAVGAMGAIALTGDRIQELFGAVNNRVEVAAGESGSGDPAGEESGEEDPGPGGPGEAGIAPVVAGSFNPSAIGSGATSSFAWSADNAVSLTATAQYSGACAAAGSYGTNPRPLAWSALGGAENFAWSADVAGCSEQVCVTAANAEGESQSCASLAYAALDKAPDNLQFVSLPSVDRPIVEPNYFARSFPVILTGFDGTITVSVTGGAASLDGGPEGTFFENVAEGTEIELFIDTADVGQTATMTVTAGSVTTSWSVTSPAADHNPENFWIAEDENLEPGAEYDTAENLTVIEGVSEPITITMLTPGSFFTHYGDAVWLTTGEVAPGDELVFKTTAPATWDTSKEIQIQAGDLPYTWTIATRAQVIDAYIPMIPASEAPINQQVESQPFTVTGFDGPLTASVSSTGATAKISAKTGGVWGPFLSSVAVYSDQELKLQTTAGGAAGDSVTTTLSLGSSQQTWDVVATLFTDPFGFVTEKTFKSGTAWYRASNVVTISGLSGSATMVVSGLSSAGYNECVVVNSVSTCNGYLGGGSSYSFQVSNGMTVKMQANDGYSLPGRIITISIPSLGLIGQWQVK